MNPTTLPHHFPLKVFCLFCRTNFSGRKVRCGLCAAGCALHLILPSLPPIHPSITHACVVDPHRSGANRILLGGLAFCFVYFVKKGPWSRLRPVSLYLRCWPMIPRLLCLQICNSTALEGQLWYPVSGCIFSFSSLLSFFFLRP